MKRRTVCATLLGPEMHYLVRMINEAKEKIDVRCIAIEEASLVACLKRASERGCTVRIVVDRVSPLLYAADQSGNSNLQIQELRKQDQGRFLMPSYNATRRQFSLMKSKVTNARTKRYLQKNEPEATIEVDLILLWNGVAILGPRHWVDISDLVIHTRDPDPKEGASRFLLAWNRSRPIQTKTALSALLSG